MLFLGTVGKIGGIHLCARKWKSIFNRLLRLFSDLTPRNVFNLASICPLRFSRRFDVLGTSPSIKHKWIVACGSICHSHRRADFCFFFWKCGAEYFRNQDSRSSNASIVGDFIMCLIREYKIPLPLRSSPWWDKKSLRFLRRWKTHRWCGYPSSSTAGTMAKWPSLTTQRNG